MYQTALSLARTREEKNILSQEINLLSKSLFKPGAFEKALSESIRAETAGAIKKDLAGNIQNVENYLESLLASLADLEPLSLTLAFEPTDGNIEKFYEWASVNVSPKIFLDIEHDPSILGGAVVSFRGKYHDFSLRAELENYLTKNREKLIKAANPK
jgi:hypothetical protein